MNLDEPPSSGRAVPHSPFEDVEAKLDDLLGSFPDPSIFGTPVKLDSSNDNGSSVNATEGSMYEPPSSTASVHHFEIRVEPENHALPPSRSNSASSSIKHNLPETPPTNRPFKKLREVFTSKLPAERSPLRTVRTENHNLSPIKAQHRPSPSYEVYGHARSPSKIPLPISPPPKKSPLDVLPPVPSDLEDILGSFRYAQTHLHRSIHALDAVQADLKASRRQSEEKCREVAELKAERKKINEALSDARSDADELREALRRARAEKGKAAQESAGIIARLETRLRESDMIAKTMKGELGKSANEKRSMEDEFDKRMFVLKEKLDTAQQALAWEQEQAGKMRIKLEEAEFAHRALKEGGARLARDLMDKERRIGELERAWQGKRGGVV